MAETRHIPEPLLGGLYRRVLDGEKWRDVARSVPCSDTGLKMVLDRAGYDIHIRAVRKQLHDRTRDFVPLGWCEELAYRMQSARLR